MSGRFDAVLVLGVALDEQDGPTQEMRARAQAAARAVKRLEAERGECPVVIACGGVTLGHARAEADVLAQLLKKEGVPQERIVCEDRSQDTMENLRFAARLLGGAGGKRVLVVTSDYHLRRAVWTAWRAGFAARGEAAALERDGAWRALRRKEWAYTLDLILGWQDEGRTRPKWARRLFDAVFSKKEKKGP